MTLKKNFFFSKSFYIIVLLDVDMNQTSGQLKPRPIDVRVLRGWQTGSTFFDPYEWNARPNDLITAGIFDEWVESYNARFVGYLGNELDISMYFPELPNICGSIGRWERRLFLPDKIVMPVVKEGGKYIIHFGQKNAESKAYAEFVPYIPYPGRKCFSV